MTPQSSPRTARVAMTFWDTLLWGVVGLRDYISQDSPRTIGVTMTPQDNPVSVRVAMASLQVIPE